MVDAYIREICKTTYHVTVVRKYLGSHLSRTNSLLFVGLQYTSITVLPLCLVVLMFWFINVKVSNIENWPHGVRLQILSQLFFLSYSSIFIRDQIENSNAWRSAAYIIWFRCTQVCCCVCLLLPAFNFISDRTQLYLTASPIYHKSFRPFSREKIWA